MIAAIAASRLGRTIAAVVAALLAIVTFGAMKKREGRSEARTEAERRDRDNADAILDRIDDVDGVPDNYDRHFRD